MFYSPRSKRKIKEINKFIQKVLENSGKIKRPEYKDKNKK